jgi:hypothetical protein
MLRMCVCMHSRFVENHPIWIREDGPLIFEVVLSPRWIALSTGEDRVRLEKLIEAIRTSVGGTPDVVGVS